MQTAKSEKMIMGLMSSVFFMWGALTCMNDLLVPKLKANFHLDYTQVMLVQFCFFLTYAIVSLPASGVIARIGYKKGILLGLFVSALGCGVFVLASHGTSFNWFLFGLFILASGIVCLQVAANPFVTLLGEAKYASSRLNFAQALNSLGTTLVPLALGAAIIEGSIAWSYSGIIVILLIFILIIAYAPFPKLSTEMLQQQGQKTPLKEVLKHPGVILGVAAIFLYVGTEVSAGSFLVNYLNLPSIANMSKIQAAGYLSFFWGGALIGRFIGAWILRYVNPARLVMNYALINALLVATSIYAHGSISMWCILSLGLFNSVMFPTIFAIALEGMGAMKSQVSGLLCTAIAGGAIIPELQGMLADKIGLQASFIVLVFTYLLLAGYAFLASRRAH